MHRYETQTPRAAFAIAAVILSVATMGACIGAPSTLDGCDGGFIVARAVQVTPVTISPAVIEVVASRHATVNVAAAPASTTMR
jgi:hypothetical protein